MLSIGFFWNGNVPAPQMHRVASCDHTTTPSALPQIPPLTPRQSPTSPVQFQISTPTERFEGSGGGPGGGGGGQSPEVLLLSWQLAESIDGSPLTKIHQAAVLAPRFGGVGGGGVPELVPLTVPCRLQAIAPWGVGAEEISYDSRTTCLQRKPVPCYLITFVCREPISLMAVWTLGENH